VSARARGVAFAASVALAVTPLAGCGSEEPSSSPSGISGATGATGPVGGEQLKPESGGKNKGGGADKGAGGGASGGSGSG